MLQTRSYLSSPQITWLESEISTHSELTMIKPVYPEEMFRILGPVFYIVLHSASSVCEMHPSIAFRTTSLSSVPVLRLGLDTQTVLKNDGYIMSGASGF